MRFVVKVYIAIFPRVNKTGSLALSFINELGNDEATDRVRWKS
jgi:hypothetical protein